MKGQLFISTFPGTLDGKGRVCIPAPYREALAAQETGGVYIRPIIGQPMLEGFGEVLMQDYYGKVAQDNPYASADMDDDPFFAMSLTQMLPRDENGRVRLPEDFIAHAGLTDRVTFVGLGSRFQIWEPQAHAQMLEARKQRHHAAMAAKAAQAGQA